MAKANVFLDHSAAFHVIGSSTLLEPSIRLAPEGHLARRPPPALLT